VNVDTWGALNAALTNIVAEALKEVGEKVAAQMKLRINKDVYSANSPTKYERTNQLMDSVTTSDVETNQGESEVKISHDTDKIHYNPSKFQHGSPPTMKRWGKTIDIKGSGDISEWIPEIIAFNKSGNLFGSGWWQNRDNYYLNTLEDLKSQGLLSKWFRVALRKRGIDMV